MRGAIGIIIMITTTITTIIIMIMMVIMMMTKIMIIKIILMMRNAIGPPMCEVGPAYSTRVRARAARRSQDGLCTYFVFWPSWPLSGYFFVLPFSTSSRRGEGSIVPLFV